MAFAPTFPPAQQAQISVSVVWPFCSHADCISVRANQRDLFHVASLKEQAEDVLRSWLGELRTCIAARIGSLPVSRD